MKCSGGEVGSYPTKTRPLISGTEAGLAYVLLERTIYERKEGSNMNATTTTDTVHPIQGSITSSVARSGSLMEAIGAIATVALAIVGLAGVFSVTMASIATIVIGAAILIEGASLTA